MYEFKEEKMFLEQTQSVKTENTVLFTGEPIEEIYTLVARPNALIATTLEDVVKPLIARHQELFAYKKTQYHATIMGDIPVAQDQSELSALFKEVAKDYPLHAIYKGLHLRNAALFVSVYFEKDMVHKLREALRQKLPTFVDYSSYLEGLDHVSWLNLARFSSPITEALKEDVLTYHSALFGSENHPQLQFYRTSSLTLDTDQSELIAKI